MKYYFLPTLKILLAVLLFSGLQASASPNTAIAPMALLQQQVVVEALLGMDARKEQPVTSVAGDLQSRRLVAPWNNIYVSERLQAVRSRFEQYLEYECPASYEEPLQDKNYILANGLALLQKQINEWKQQVNWDFFNDQFDPGRRVVIVDACNIHRFPCADLITKQLDQTSNVASDNKNIEDYWFTGQPAYIVAATRDRQWLLLMGAMQEAQGWVHCRHAASVTAEQCEQLARSPALLQQGLSGRCEALNFDSYFQAGSLLIKHLSGYQALLKKVAPAERARHSFDLYPAQLAEIELYDSAGKTLPEVAVRLPLSKTADKQNQAMFIQLLWPLLGKDFAWGGWQLQDQTRLSFDTSKFIQMSMRLCAGVEVPRDSQGILGGQGDELFDLDYGVGIIRSYYSGDQSKRIITSALNAATIGEYAFNETVTEIKHGSKLRPISSSITAQIQCRQQIIALIVELGKTGDIFGFPPGGEFIYLGHTTKAAIEQQAVAQNIDQPRVNEFFPHQQNDEPVLLFAGCQLGGSTPGENLWSITGCSHVFGVSAESPYYGKWLDRMVHLVRPFKKTKFDLN
ncbi:hypothetical protein ACWJJH_15000 [Endozoicomonadaceae bacterium StTr2]